MKLRLLASIVISLMLLTACVADVVPPTPIPSPSPAPAPAPAPSPTPSTPSSPSTNFPPTSQMPLSVTLHHIGVKSNQAGSGTADIYFLLVITDGYEQATQRFLPAGGTFQLNCYETIELNQEVFHTDSAGDSLKVCILAYKQNDPLWQSSILIPTLAEIENGLAWGDYRSANEILSTVDKHMEKSETSFADGGDSLIGYFEDVWGTNESLGIGQYNGVGTDDLRLWFSIWSTDEPKVQPPTLLPDVELEDINMVSTASTGQTRTDIVRIHNKEPHPVTITLKGSSLLAGEFYNQDIEMAADGYEWVENDVVNEIPGVDAVTYNVYFRDTELDSESEDLRVITDKRQITIVEWRNSGCTTRIEKNILEETPITLYIEAPGYTGTQFSASIRMVEPDGSHRYEETMLITIINGRGLGHWKAKWQPVLEGDPTYLFGVKGLFSNELTVVKKYEPPPDVSIEAVDIVPYVNAGEVRTDAVTIINNESELVVVRLKGYSTTTGEFYNSAVSIPAEGSTTVNIPSSCDTPGVGTITYKLYFQGVEFDAKSRLLEVF